MWPHLLDRQRHYIASEVFVAWLRELTGNVLKVIETLTLLDICLCVRRCASRTLTNGGVLCVCGTVAVRVEPVARMTTAGLRS